MYPRYADNPLKEKSILTGELEPTNEGYALPKFVLIDCVNIFLPKTILFILKH